jgi:hypothetical protein
MINLLIFSKPHKLLSSKKNISCTLKYINICLIFSSEEESSDEESENDNTDSDNENIDKVLPVDESESETKNDRHECTADLLTLNNSDDTKDDSGIQTELDNLDICADKI